MRSMWKSVAVIVVLLSWSAQAAVVEPQLCVGNYQT